MSMRCLSLLMLLLSGPSITTAQVADTTPPQLVSFSITPVQIDASAGPVVIAVRIEATDDLAGFGSGSTGSGSIDIRHSSGSNPIGSGSLPITGGDTLNPVFEFNLTMPRYSKQGLYPINIRLIDNVFNSVSYTPAQLEALGFPGYIEVTSVGDETPPQLVDFSITPLQIDASSSAVAIAVRIEASDDLAGFGSGSTGSGSIDVRHTSGSNPIGSGSLPITGGNPLNPVFEFTLSMPRYSKQGIYPVSIRLIDNTFNSVSYSSAQLGALGFPASIEVTSVGDESPPSLIDFEVTPIKVDSTGAATISVRIEAVDDLAGFGSGSTGSGSIDVRHESGSNPFGSGSLPITGGDNLQPVFELQLQIPEFSPLGRYPISLRLIDNVFNSVTYTSAQLEALGLPSAVQRRVIPVGDDDDVPNLNAQPDASGRFVVFQSGVDGDFGILRGDVETGATQLVSVDDAGDRILGDAIEPSVSADGNLIVFVAPDAGVGTLRAETKAARAARHKSTSSSVWLRNLLTGTTHRVGPAPIDPVGTRPQIAPGGDAVVFTSTIAPNGLPLGAPQIFVTPLSDDGGLKLPQTPRCVSCKSIGADGSDTAAEANGMSRNPVISADAEWVAFETTATNLLSSQPPPCPTASDIILRNLLTGASRRINAPVTPSACGAPGSANRNPAMDYSGQVIVYESDQPLDGMDDNELPDVYVLGATGKPIRLSVPVGGGDANAAVTQPAVSGDGRTVSFVSQSSNLDGGQTTEGTPNIYTLSVSGGDLRRVSAHAGQGKRETSRPKLDYNGRRLVSDSADVLPDLVAASQVFVRVHPDNESVVFFSSFE